MPYLFVIFQKFLIYFCEYLQIHQGRKDSTSEILYKSAMTYHKAQQNHIIDKEGASIVDRDSNPFTIMYQRSYSNQKDLPLRSTAMTVLST